MLSNAFSHLRGKTVIRLIIVCLILIQVFQLGVGGIGTRTTTVAEYSTFTVTEIKEERLIRTIVKTVVTPKIVESEYRTYSTVTTSKIMRSIIYRYSTVVQRSKVDLNGKKWTTLYIVTQIPEEVTVTALAWERIRTVATTLITVTATMNLTQFLLDFKTSTILNTGTLTKIYETEYVEDSEEEESRLFIILKNYGLITAAVIIIFLAIIPKTLLRRKPLRKKRS